MIAYYSSLAMVTSAVLYLVAMVVHAAEWASARTVKAADAGSRPARGRRVELLGRVGVAITVVAALSHLAAVVLRGIAAGRLPWGNMYEFVTSSLAAVALVYLVLALRYRMRWLGLPVTLLLTVGQGLAVTVFWVQVAPLMPALHSVWFRVHIGAAALSAAAFNIGGIAAILYLLRTRAEQRNVVTGYLARVPDAETLDRISYRFHAFAFPLWTFTIAAGAIWAQYAWGRFWNWDPKETFSLVTWIIYAGYLHARVTAGWKGRRAAVVAIIGLVSFWFNFVGINLIAPGLHSYAGI